MADDKKDAWVEQFFPKQAMQKKQAGQKVTRNNKISDNSGPFWVSQLFEKSAPASDNRLQIIKDGTIIHEYALSGAEAEIRIGRHPNADIQLEATKMSMFHAAIIQKDGCFYIEDLGSDQGTLFNGEKLQAKTAVRVFDTYVVELPGYRLGFHLPNMPAVSGETKALTSSDMEVLAEPPRFCPLHSHLISERDKLGVWTKGTVALKVADIIDETRDTKTFRLVGEQPLLFSYHPGQFVTLVLNIDGQEVQRSYSMSSSPSRPHCLELTVCRVPGGLVSNWLCDNVKLGDKLTVKGPGGKFTCFEYPSNKMLFIAAGSGITPLMSMSRWVADTAADVDIKFLVSAKFPSKIIFRKELELLSARHSGFRVAVTITSDWTGSESWTGFTGRIDKHIINAVVPDLHERHVFICGPELFMEDIKELLKGLGFPMHNFHSESFGGKRVVQGVRQSETILDGKYQIKFGTSHVIGKADERSTVLELAEMHGVEIDYSCRAGYCGECMVKCKGQVEISPECEIDAKDIQAGYIYACCTRARSDLEVDA